MLLVAIKWIQPKAESDKKQNRSKTYDYLLKKKPIRTYESDKDLFRRLGFNEVFGFAFGWSPVLEHLYRPLVIVI